MMQLSSNQIKKNSLILLGNHLELFSRSDSPCIFAVCSDVSVEILRQLINQPCSKFQEFLENDLNLWPNLIK